MMNSFQPVRYHLKIILNYFMIFSRTYTKSLEMSTVFYRNIELPAGSVISPSLPVLGVNGWIKSIGGGLGVVESNGQVDASSSGRKFEADGEVVSDEFKSTPSRPGSVDITILFIFCCLWKNE